MRDAAREGDIGGPPTFHASRAITSVTLNPSKPASHAGLQTMTSKSDETIPASLRECLRNLACFSYFETCRAPYRSRASMQPRGKRAEKWPKARGVACWEMHDYAARIIPFRTSSVMTLKLARR